MSKDRLQWLRRNYAHHPLWQFLTAMAGDAAVILGEEEKDAALLQARGKKWNYRAVFRRGQRSQCHRNSSALWLTDTKRYRLVTGYSMTWDEDGLGVWRQHTWVFDTKTKRILETTEKRDIYFGYELSWDEAQAFAWENP